MENKHGFTHYIECTKCMQPGIYLKRKPEIGDSILAHCVFFTDGTSPRPGDLCRCQCCGFRLMLHNQQLREVKE